MSKSTKQGDGLDVAVSTTSENGHTIILGNLEGLKRHLERSANHRQNPEVIKKASIVDGRRLTVSYTEKTANGVDGNTRKCSAPIHPDLRKAFANLDVHLARLCFQPLEQENPFYEPGKDFPEFVLPVHCIGFSITGNEDAEAVTLHGFRTLPNAKEISIESPSQKWEGDIYSYKDIEDLSECVMTCIGEVELYLFPSEEWPNCKIELDNQLSLFPDDEESEQDKMDKEMPLTDDMAAKVAKKSGRKAKTEE